MYKVTTISKMGLLVGYQVVNERGIPTGYEYDEDEKYKADTRCELMNIFLEQRQQKEKQNNTKTEETMNTTEPTEETNAIEFTRLTNDVNGNPRYVVHFLEFISNEEGSVSELYEKAVKKANKIGGKKYNTKKYGGGIVFQSYSLPELERKINEVK